MKWLTTIVLSVLLGGISCRKFPRKFKFGAATGAYQVEGAWNISDKSPSIWDTFVHTHPERIIDGSNGDIACDSYHQWKRDIQVASELGLDFYRFSLSWTRILPNGFSNKISEEGAKYYSDLIDGLLEKGIEPVVTIYHWDLPQNLQDLGGWTNPLVADWFADYAREVYKLYADRIKTWITINEPVTFCEVSYNLGGHAPGIISPGIGNYLCNKHALLAHAKAWRIYDEEFRPKYNGKISLTNQIIWFEGADENDEEAAELARQLMGGIYSHPIFSKEGGWPKDVEKIIAEKSKKEGYSKSRLPVLSKNEIDLIKGGWTNPLVADWFADYAREVYKLYADRIKTWITIFSTYDFYGVNYYTSRTVLRAHGESTGPWPMLGAPDLDIRLSVRPEWPHGATSWFYVYPEGIRKLLSWLKEQYGDIEFFIAENGFAGFDADLEDHDRVDYYKRHLEQVLLSIDEDEVDVIAYTAWTMIDNFEWSDGYRTKFGLNDVDFKDPDRTRRQRASAKFYANLLKTRCLDEDNNSNNTTLSDKI